MTLTTNRDEDSKIKLGKSESAREILSKCQPTIGDALFDYLEEMFELCSRILVYRPLFNEWKSKKDERQTQNIKHRRPKKASSRVSGNLSTTET